MLVTLAAVSVATAACLAAAIASAALAAISLEMSLAVDAGASCVSHRGSGGARGLSFPSLSLAAMVWRSLLSASVILASSISSRPQGEGARHPGATDRSIVRGATRARVGEPATEVAKETERARAVGRKTGREGSKVSRPTERAPAERTQKALSVSS
eukprot:scaffold229067_cov33-Tisochrysis_lutea.AAC.7